VITLKDYQERVPESLCDFFRLTAKTSKPDVAFRELTRRIREANPYVPVLTAGLGSGMPYVCLHVPTGERALMACYVAGLAHANSCGPNEL
jgi:hypothetical protein